MSEGREEPQPPEPIRLSPRTLVAVGALMAFGVAVLSGVSFSPPGLPGHWFAEETVGGEVHQSMLHVTPDGRFELVRRVLRNCRVTERVSATGRWEMTPRDVTLHWQDGRAPARSNGQRFELVWLSENSLSLRSEDGGRIGGLRVPPDFGFLPPDGCPEEPLRPPQGA